MPKRIQLSRKKGFKLPANAVSVARPHKFGNPFTIIGCRDAGYIGDDNTIARICVDAFRAWLGPLWRNNWDGKDSDTAREILLQGLPELRGKDLACWCKLDAPCHADVLLEIANK